MATRVSGWICDGCEDFVERSPWNCPKCNKEICENCFHTFMHCKICYFATGETDSERAYSCARAADVMYGTDFVTGLLEDDGKTIT